jgi:hypothetical protein
MEYSGSDLKLIEEIWGDADFKSIKKAPLSGETLKKNSIRTLNSDNFYIAHCKVCNFEMKLSSNYSGEFPLCIVHRNPNDRPINSIKKVTKK